MIYLNCGFNKLKEIDLSTNKNLKELYIYNNNLKEINLRNNTLLEELHCSYNQLSNLDVSNNKRLKELDFSFNQIKEIDLSNNLALEKLYCSFNKLSSLDLSENTSLILLDCYTNSFTINVDLNTNMYDLSNLPGSFDVLKTSNWQGGELDKNIIKIDNEANRITYDYQVSDTYTANFTLEINRVKREKGDINFDTKLDANDTSEIQKYIAKLNYSVYFTDEIADVNDDGIINVLDATVIQKSIANI